jgi:hypothetical protein
MLKYIVIEIKALVVVKPKHYYNKILLLDFTSLDFT